MSIVSVSFIIALFDHVEQNQDILALLLCPLPNDLTCEIILIDDASTDANAQ